MNPIDRLRVALAESGYNFAAPITSRDKGAPWVAWKLALELVEISTEPFFAIVPQPDNPHIVNVSVRGSINGNWGDFHISIHIDDVMMQMQKTTRLLVAAWKAAHEARG